jgi:hypothetical protein
VHQEGKKFCHYVKTLCVGICLEALVLEIQRALLRYTPQDERSRTTDLGQTAFTPLVTPLALDSHTVSRTSCHTTIWRLQNTHASIEKSVISAGQLA